jgi:hypothetical protein
MCPVNTSYLSWARVTLLSRGSSAVVGATSTAIYTYYAMPGLQIYTEVEDGGLLILRKSCNQRNSRIEGEIKLNSIDIRTLHRAEGRGSEYTRTEDASMLVRATEERVCSCMSPGSKYAEERSEGTTMRR